jgi:hypothetical protein
MSGPVSIVQHTDGDSVNAGGIKVERKRNDFKKQTKQLKGAWWRRGWGC